MKLQVARWTDQTAEGNPADYSQARFVLQGRLACIRGQYVLFSSSQRAIFALNDTAADIWRSLEEGMPPEAISFEIASHGVEMQEANRHVEAALTDWERLDLIRPCLPPDPASSPEHVSQVVAVPGRCVRIVYPAGLAYPAATVFRHLEVRREDADLLLQLVDHGDRIHLFRNGNWVLSCSPEELPTMLKGQLLTEALEHGAYELAVHAAALVSNDRALLLCGNPGAGKTTLTLALVHAGFGFAGDDVALLDSSGQSVGLPFAPAVKAGAWPILAGYCPDLDAAPVFRRPDRKRVRYPVPMHCIPPSPRAVGWVVLLRRGSDAKARLDPVDPVDALRGLLNGSFAIGRELSDSAFDLLSRVIESAEAYCLTYSRLDDAVKLIRKMCR